MKLSHCSTSYLSQVYLHCTIYSSMLTVVFLTCAFVSGENALAGSDDGSGDLTKLILLVFSEGGEEARSRHDGKSVQRWNH